MRHIRHDLLKQGLMKQGLLALIAALGLLLTAAPTRAEDAFPTRPVKIVVPFPPGSGTDILARLLAANLARQWGGAVLVENIAGASGNVGAAEVARAAPDGYTLMLCPPGPITTNRFLFKDMGYDPARWVVISWLASVPYVLAARTGLADSFADLLALAKKSPNQLSYAMPGAGGTAQLSARQLEMLAGIKLLEVPYRGLGPAMNDVIGGHVDMMFDTITTSLPLHRAGRINILAVASPRRAEALPDVPTVAESGYPGYRSITWFGLVAPPGTPTALAERLNRDVAGIIQSRDVAGRLRDIQMEPVGSTRAEAAKFFADEAALWGGIIKDANITLE
jgi:tripartite-type tricarboxylate transporter receptor subunit TctC